MSDDAAYAQKIEQEIAHYRQVENVHDLPAIFHYWSNKYLLPKLQAVGLQGIDPFFIAYIERAARQNPGELRLLSVGAGNCDTEIRLAKTLCEQGLARFRFDCLDVNPHMLERGRQAAAAAAQGSRFRFVETDVNRWHPEDRYDVVVANQSLHHFADLEVLFDKISRALRQDGFFVSTDMIGRNGHMRWPEALDHVRQLWTLLEDRHKYNQQLHRFEPVYENWDCSSEGFEGIRAQDILPLLVRRFGFEVFVGFGNVIDIFTDRAFGHNFDVQNPRDLAFIDYVALLDDWLIDHGLVKPTHMIAAMTLRRDRRPRVYRHWTPEFCLRPPGPRVATSLRRALELVRRTGVHRLLPAGVRQRVRSMLLPRG